VINRFLFQFHEKRWMMLEGMLINVKGINGDVALPLNHYNYYRSTVYTRVQVTKFTTKSWSKSREGDLCEGHDSTGETRSHFPSTPLAANGAVASTTLAVAPVSIDRDGVWSLFLSLPWSASLPVERGESFDLTTIS